MITRTLNINEINITANPVVYTCYGLGSCIALFLTDRVKKLSGGAHIPMPAATDEGAFLDAITMFHALLIGFRDRGSNMCTLRAKIAGGSQIHASPFQIGERNVKTILKELIQYKIFLAGLDVGGSFSRTVRYNSMTCELEVKTSDQKIYWI